ncbi:MAG: serine/threonine-protein phosphatase [Deltaproteobacteria bacterium]|jgi:protein phosphatase|nr:serine/threonine-protein phosphatase [Deltaproteobacteria bacterium]
METEGSGASRAGGEGIHNEDAYLVEEGMGLYVVCDGASNASAGEIAAGIATEALEEFVARSDEELDLRWGWIARPFVAEAMTFAMASVRDAERNNPELRGLATTVTMLLTHGNIGIIGHRGDSRAYLFRYGRAHQLTVDHELTEAAGNGGDGEVDCDVFAIDLKPGDTIVLCTDGAEQVIEDEAIARAVATLSPRLLASRIVGAAHRFNPECDATAVVVRLRRENERGWIGLSDRPRGTTFGHTLEYA